MCCADARQRRRQGLGQIGATRGQSARYSIYLLYWYSIYLLYWYSIYLLYWHSIYLLYWHSIYLLYWYRFTCFTGTGLLALLYCLLALLYWYTDAEGAFFFFSRLIPTHHCTVSPHPAAGVGRRCQKKKVQILTQKAPPPFCSHLLPTPRSGGQGESSK